MRPEVWQVVTRAGPVVLVTGDTGTGKSSVLQATVAEYANTVVAPPVAVCLFDSGALQTGLFDALSTVLATAGPGQARWRDLAKRLRHATQEAAIEVGKALADAVIEEVVEFAKTKLGENAGKGLLKFWKTLADRPIEQHYDQPFYAWGLIGITQPDQQPTEPEPASEATDIQEADGANS